MIRTVTVKPQNITLRAEDGAGLYDVLRAAGFAVNALCGGSGRCGKCRVLCNGKTVLACRTVIDGDMEVTLPEYAADTVGSADGAALAFDIGTTTVAGFLIDENGVCASASRLNPQISYGADVVSRLRFAASGGTGAQSELIRSAVSELSRSLCRDLTKIKTVSIVGNPAMQQIFLGLPVDNLINIPYKPIITDVLRLAAAEYLPELINAELVTVPDPSAYVGGDTVACVLAEGMYDCDRTTLLVDIGTNGELVLADRGRLFCCSTAAGPALEGAGISCGMRCETGAVFRVDTDGSGLTCRVMGGGPARGICGSGLLDAAAALLSLELIDRRGRIKCGGSIELIGGVTLTQEDIRALQLAKGAVAAGAAVLTRRAGIHYDDIDRVLLAGAFGSALRPEAACKTGLIPSELAGKLHPVGNAAGRGAVLMAQSKDALRLCGEIVSRTEPVELASEPDFSRLFAENMYFR